MNPAQRIPARYREHIYTALAVLSAVALVFPEIGGWPTRVFALANALGFTVARANVASKPG